MLHFRRYCIFLLLLICCQIVMAQSVDSLNAMHERRIFSGYHNHQNAASIITDTVPEFGYVSVSGHYEAGNYKRPMDPERSCFFDAGTGGHRKIKEISLHGDFHYRKKNDEGLAWSSVANAYNGNPFIWVDSSTGKWVRDEVKAALTLASPLVANKLFGGLSMDYAIGSGARLNEPKPFYRFRDLSLNPAINLQFNSNSRAGISGNFEFTQEENEIGFYTNENLLLYRLRGYGTFSRSPMVTGNRKQSGNILGLGLHFNKKNEKYQWLIAGRADYRTEEVYEGIAIQSITGYYTAYRFEGNTVLYKGDINAGTSVEINAIKENGKADDFAFKAESASHNKTHISLLWNKWWTNHSNQLWQYMLQPVFNHTMFTDFATRTQYTVSRGGVTASLLWRNQISKSFFLKLSPKMSYMPVINHDWVNSQTNTIIKELIKPHYNYLSASFWNGGLNASLEWRSGFIAHIISFHSSYYWANTTESKFHRQMNQLQYSILF